MKKRIVAAFAMMASLVMAMPAYAGSWKQDDKGWWYQKDDGQYSHDCWRWIDGNGDGLAEHYYFNSAGYLLTNTSTPDGKQVDGNGAALGWDGKAIQKPVASLANFETTLTMKNGVPYYKEEVSTWDSTEQNEEANTWTQEEAFTGRQEEEFTDEELALRIIELINEEREKLGKPSLAVNDELMENAAVRAEEAAEEFSHTRPDGTGFYTAITVSNELTSAENLSKGGLDYGRNTAVDIAAQSVVDGWMHSPGHKANLLPSYWTETGVGIHWDDNGAVTVSQLFIKTK